MLSAQTLQWGSDTADFFFEKFVPAGLSLENLEAEKKNAIGTMLTAVREDISQLPRTVKAQGATWIGWRSVWPTQPSIHGLPNGATMWCWPALCSLRTACGPRTG
jgi:hypothetical protein